MYLIFVFPLSLFILLFLHTVIMQEDVALNPSLALQKVPIKMKPGEYELHILIQTSTQLKSPEVGTDITALICCTAFGKRQYSTKKKGVGRETVNWGEHFYFNKQFTNIRQALGARLLITVYNYNLLRANSEIGSWEMDIYKIYENEGHCLNHEWLGLSSAVNDFKEVKGYLKISVSLTGENDKTIPLRPEKIDTLTPEKRILLPPSIILRSYEITVKVFAARDLKPCDGQAADAYVSAEFWNIHEKTLAVRRTTQPTFNKIIYLPVWLPAKTDSLTIRLVDHNDFIADEILGSFYPTLNDIFNRRYSSPKWINFYGPQIEASGKQWRQHTLYPQLATYYTGTVLMSISIEETDGPRRGVEPLEEQYAPPKMILYRLTLDIHCAVNLFQKSKMHKILIKFGVHEIDTYFTRARNGFAGWFIKKTIVLRAFANSQIPNLFVYIVNQEKKKTSYLRFNVNVNEKLPAQFMPLLPDLAIKTMPPEETGLLKFGFELNLAPKMEPAVESIINSPLNIIQGSKVPQGRLICNLYNAIELAPRDTEGTSDPFIVISFFDQSERSTLKRETLNASYFQNIVLNTVLFQESEAPPIVISVYDQDAMSYQLIGCFNMNLSSAILEKCLGVSGNQVIPVWVPIYSSGVQTGKLLLSFQMYYHTNIPANIPRNIVIALKKFLIEGFVMSIDDLQMWGFTNLHHPYLQFDYKSINPPGTMEVKNYNSPIGQIVEKGIQIKQVHKAIVMLPESTAYWTQLGVRLKDRLVGSMYQPLIGYFSINLAEAHKRSKLFNKFLRKQIENNRLPSAKQYNNLKYSTVSVQRLKSLHKNIIICFSRFIIQGLNYSWNFLSPTTILNHLGSQRQFNPGMVVVFPTYTESITKVFTENFKQMVDMNHEYVVVGYDRTNQKATRNVERRNRHYRFALAEPLKDFYRSYYNAEVGISNNIQIHTGRKLVGDDIVTNIMKMLVLGDTYRGLFKGEFLVQQYKQIGEMNPIEREIQDLRVSRIRRRIMGCRVYVFVYVIDCHNLPSKDTFSPSDSYLRVSIGNQTQDNSFHYVPDDANPKFFQKFKFLVSLPQQSILTIQVWDQDDIDMDDLIGYIKIDVENRFWQNENQITTCNPIQTWQLKCDTSKLSQGDIRFWLDLVPFEMIELYKQFDITPKPKKKFQIRVIVWGCDDIPPNNFEKMSDFYIVCEFNGENQRTDTHWRSVTGDGNFNWRMVFDVELPIADPMLSFKVYDKDLLSADDYKASTSFSIGTYLEDAFENEIGGYLYLGDTDLSKTSEVSFCGSKLINGRTMYNRFIMEMLSPEKNQRQQHTLIERKPTVDISIQILTDRQAIAKPAGKGRQHPNMNPTLPDPTGRFDFGFNPFNLASKLCGKKYRYKAVGYCVLFLVILTVYNLLISMIGGIIANAII